MPPPLTAPLAIKALAVFAAIVAVAVSTFLRHHSVLRFGPANQVTTLRALLVACVAGCIGESASASLAWLVIVLGVGATLLDGVDGWLARRTGTTSAFGARFDMEVDALLIMALAILVWQHQKAGAWILAAGLLRYLFVAAGAVWPWMRGPLPRTFRARAICVVQITTLLAAMLPVLPSPASAIVAAAGLVALCYSFAADTLRLSQL